MFDFLNQNIAIFGLARSGISLKTFLKRNSFCGKIYLFDDDQKKLEKFGGEKNIIVCKPEEVDWSKVGCLVMSPGINPNQNHPLLNLARTNNVKITIDIELFYSYVIEKNPNAKFVGITGTNGKSTTTAMIYHILKNARLKVENGGNIGVPIFDLPTNSDFYVIEVSSYQMDLMKNIRFDYGILTNITPDHLERYDFKFENYIASKKRIIDLSDKMIISIDNENTKKIANELISRKELFTTSVYDSNVNYFCASGTKEHIIECNSEEYKFRTKLLGKHNLENIVNCFACCDLMELQREKIISGIESFESLPHRLQELRTMRNIRFINDSKATSGDALASALNSFDNDEEIYLILGGVPKTDGLEAIKNLLYKVKKFYLIGQASQEFYNFLSDNERKEDVFLCETLEKACKSSIGYCNTDENHDIIKIILLSPACASFDQFKDFEDRGNKFIEIINHLKIGIENGKKSLCE